MGWNWMGDLPDDKTFNAIIMPGSHDAGLYEVTQLLGMASDPASVLTQTSNIRDQLIAGSRFFDFRVYNRPGHGLHLGHFAEGVFLGIGSKKGKHDHGGYGPSLLTVLSDIYDYFRRLGETETAILRFSHIKTKWARDIVEMVKSTLDDLLYKATNPFGYNIASTPIGGARGKVIACFETRSFADFIDPAEGIHAFQKHPAANTNGLICCGNFHGQNQMPRVITDAEAGIEAHVEHEPEHHLGQIYWQLTFLTGGDIVRHTETHAKPELIRYCERYGPDLKRNLNNPFSGGMNIFSYDCVDEYHCGAIAAMNWASP